MSKENKEVKIKRLKEERILTAHGHKKKITKSTRKKKKS
ncbi:hypothetical protein AB751O23_AT_00090 [Chlamydiales bacterium SCGC AB-751-O23]|jgi:hypothetical protein|nr:hypothetical protein AB751O23_AT_00090 [Chlamydiales bacterium SCGC AB-751-O23]